MFQLRSKTVDSFSLTFADKLSYFFLLLSHLTGGTKLLILHTPPKAEQKWEPTITSMVREKNPTNNFTKLNHTKDVGTISHLPHTQNQGHRRKEQVPTSTVPVPLRCYVRPEETGSLLKAKVFKIILKICTWVIV